MPRFLTLDELEREQLSAGIGRMLRRNVKRSPYAQADGDVQGVTVLQSMRIWIVSARDLREAAQDGRDLRHIARETNQDHHQLGSSVDAVRLFATSVAVDGKNRSVTSVADGHLAEGLERALAQLQGLGLSDWEIRRLRVPELRTEVLWARGPGEMPDFTCLLTTMLSLPPALDRMHSSLELIAALATARSIESWPESVRFARP